MGLVACPRCRKSVWASPSGKIPAHKQHAGGEFCKPGYQPRPVKDPCHDRLVTVIDEEFGLQPVAASTEELLTSLERLLFERRIQNENQRTAERADRLRLTARVAELEAELAKTKEHVAYFERRARELGMEDW